MRTERIMSERRSVVGWLHLMLTVLLLGSVLTLGVLVAAGKFEIRQVNPSPLPPGPSIHAMAIPAFFDQGDRRAYCFKWEGTWIDCWIDVDIDGKKTRVADDLGKSLRVGAEAQEGPDKKPASSELSGQLVWFRHGERDKEVWELHISRISSDGKLMNGASTSAFTPPQSDATLRVRKGAVPRTEFAEVSGSSGSLSDGKELTLATFLTYGENGQVIRKAELKCKAVK